MKLNFAVLSGRHLTATAVQLTRPDAAYVMARTVATAAVHAADDYEKSKPFSSIPGPSGLPYFGTLFYYRAGKLFQSAHVRYFTVRIAVDHIRCRPK